MLKYKQLSQFIESAFKLVYTDVKIEYNYWTWIRNALMIDENSIYFIDFCIFWSIYEFPCRTDLLQYL